MHGGLYRFYLRLLQMGGLKRFQTIQFSLFQVRSYLLILLPAFQGYPKLVLLLTEQVFAKMDY